jgi:NhaP-type Na+/H+ or K+/H+ antiporter
MLLVVYAVTLFVAVLISCKAKESILSVSVLFLVAGFLVGEGVLGAKPPNRDVLYLLSEVALFSVLFTDGMSTGGLKKITSQWHLSGRALLLGMPLTIAGIAMLAHWLVGLSWTASLLIGSVLSPTDPIFASAIFGFEAIPQRVKQVLNLESGLNDGLALPAVLITLDALAHQSQGFGKILEEMLLGIIIGVAIPWIGIKLEQSRMFGATGLFQRLNAFALGLIVLAVSVATNANLFLAAFAAGITIASVSQSVTKAFEGFGELITELLKLAALLIFGARVAPTLFAAMSWNDYVFAALALFLVRPLVMEVSYLRSGLSKAEVLTIGWFGPKGFSSVVYALMVLRTGTPVADHVARISALVIAASIVIYSSTDILVGRWYQTRRDREKESLPEAEKAA